MKIHTSIICAGLLAACHAPAQVIYNNGPLISNPGAGFGGADASAITAPGTLFGSSALQGSFRVSDGFQVPAGEQWHITGARFFSYQTGSTTVSTFTGLTLRIWDAAPDSAGASVVWGNTTDNVLAASSFSGIYRVTTTALTGNTRPIMNLDVDLDLHLNSGTYWVDWSASGSLASGPWAPPIAIPGQPATGDALQLNVGTGVWTALIDSGSGAPQGLPFELSGMVIPEPTHAALLGLGLAALAITRRRSLN